MGINTGANASFGPASKDGGTPGTIAGVSGLAAEPQYSRNVAFIDPSATAGGNLYTSWDDAYNAMGGAAGGGTMIPACGIVDSGTDDGSGSASNLADSTKAWTVDEHVGRVVRNHAELSFGVITANTADTITAIMVDYDTTPDWNPGNNYDILDALYIPASAYDLSLYRIKGDWPLPQHILIADGATATGLRDFGNVVLIKESGAVPFITDIEQTGSDDIALGFTGTRMLSMGTGPIIRTPLDSELQFLIGTGSALIGTDSGGLYEPVQANNGSTLYVLIDAFGQVYQDCIESGATSTVNLVAISTAAMGWQAPQANAAGALNRFNFTAAANLAVDSSAFSGVLSTADDTVQKALATVDGMGIAGLVVGYDFSALASDVTTTDTSSPPTVVLHSFSYDKKSATSVLIVNANATCFGSEASTGLFRLFHGSTGINGIAQSTHSTNLTNTAPLADSISGLAVGAVTIGVRWAVTSGTISCDASTNPLFRGCTITVIEVEQ